MKTTKFIVLLSFFALCSSCKKEDLTDSIDITQYSWKMKSITINGNITKIPNVVYHNDKAYILIFKNDSILQLNTSVNLAKGSYQIISKGNIHILNYGEITEVGGQNEIDHKLLQNISSITIYQVLDDDLFLKGDNFEIEFQKE